MTTPFDSLRGKTVLVTGAAKRIGKAVALALADAGSNVVIHYNRSERESEDTADHVRRHGVSAWTVRANLSDSSETASLVDNVLDMTGAIDCLVNSASVFPESTVDSIGASSLADVVGVNALAPLVLSRAFARRAGTGAIVNILDNRIDRIDTVHAEYQLSKGMLHTLTLMTAVEFAPRIRVNAVAPGLILPPPGHDAAYLGNLTGRTLLGRHGSPDDIAGAVLYLLTAPFVTGQILVVDGGENLKRAAYGGV